MKPTESISAKTEFDRIRLCDSTPCTTVPRVVRNVIIFDLKDIKLAR